MRCWTCAYHNSTGRLAASTRKSCGQRPRHENASDKEAREKTGPAFEGAPSARYIPAMKALFLMLGIAVALCIVPGLVAAATSYLPGR